MKYLFTAMLVLTIHCTFSQQRHDPANVITRIAFGSCSREDSPEQMWDEIVKLDPQLWIWGGDNIYGDTHDMDLLREKYDQQKANEGYSKLRNTCPIIGTWDDHDYGVNDGGRFFSKKTESRDLMLEFLDVPLRDPIRSHEGVYSSYTFGSGKKKVKVINLDTRYFRDSVWRESALETVSGQRVNYYVANESGDILGEVQWQWLEMELRLSDAAINIINSSIQVLSEEHRFEKWANFPAARRRLLDLIAASKANGVLVVSGDRHIAEFSKIQLPGLPYPLYDFTSSGLTHTWREAAGEPNKYRVGELIVEKTFGFIEIDWTQKRPSVTLSIRGNGQKIYASQKVEY